MANKHRSKIRGAAKPGKPKGFAGYDVLGNIVVVKFDRNATARSKKLWGERYLREHKSVTTVLEKVEGFSRRLRTQTTKWVAGEKTKEVLYKENGCVFRFNVDSCYFSPRLSSERLELAKKVKKGESVLVMFGGVAPFAIVIAKNSKAGKIVSVELGRECNRYAKDNVKRNKVENVKIVGGDVRRRVPELDNKFNQIIMARPNLKDSFLDVGFSAIKKGGMIYYYGFYPVEEKDKLLGMIQEEAKAAKKKIKIVNVKKAGEVGVRRFRFRVDVKVL